MTFFEQPDIFVQSVDFNAMLFRELPQVYEQPLMRLRLSVFQFGSIRFQYLRRIERLIGDRRQFIEVGFVLNDPPVYFVLTHMFSKLRPPTRCKTRLLFSWNPSLFIHGVR